MAWGKREHGKHWKHWRDLGPSRSATVSGPFGKRLCKLGPARSEAPSGDQCDNRFTTSTPSTVQKRAASTAVFTRPLFVHMIRADKLCIPHVRYCPSSRVPEDHGLRLSE
ncbi:hypothetical protein HBH56_078720 [Parastagonospora nodorum]|uniref:Uncharacterized protein n=1 Tax=Phaeosphaeria nodorum (strain SN15 / ATCC MYA-4574 / FGSC 10173) TaxID=321614 RepID=A0A7U2IC09_PHANO|nr:hypothetical protein HBH56_078720 [Parastagonospora nodorum]QRD07046.1 hypothetical protein JI435_446790 [Parastagonospora nodorum SN15]KAH3923420.1 hypothetical protein HBH54_209230 [Parastagonospora nodorum]KAH4139109.1 hypothetical protein HBH45_096030 [Parastagonospora nodorum]KAH4166320.1 hypothetical protein HBH44_057190 [Parastagonospora nodorum]